jgi:hypothetical protein
MFGPFFHPQHPKISLDLAVSTQKAWHYGDTFWTFSWPEWHVIAESHQYHCFMEHQRGNLNFASFSGVYKVNGTVNG